MKNRNINQAKSDRKVNFTDLPKEWLVGLMELSEEGNFTPKPSGLEKGPSSVHNWSEISTLMEVKEKKLPSEVTPFVEDLKPEPNIDEELVEAGVEKVAPKSTYPTYLQKEIPMSDDEVLVAQKEPVVSSQRWLAELCIYLLKQSHIALKNIGGRVLRVRKN